MGGPAGPPELGSEARERELQLLRRPVVRCVALEDDAHGVAGDVQRPAKQRRPQRGPYVKEWGLSGSDVCEDSGNDQVICHMWGGGGEQWALPYPWGRGVGLLRPPTPPPKRLCKWRGE